MHMTLVGFEQNTPTFDTWLSAEPRDSNNQEVAADLGMAVQSALGRTNLQIMEGSTSTGRRPAREDHVPLFGLIDNRKTFERALSISASGKYGIASAQASMSESYSTSSRSIKIGYTKHIVDTEELWLGGEWKDAARTFWSESGPEEFYKRYGDQYIHRTTYGGICSIVLEFIFESEESARTFSGSFSAYGSGAGASADISQKTVRTARSTEIALCSVVRGVTDFPDVEYELDGRVGYVKKQPVDLRTVGNVLDFFNQFESLVLKGEDASLIGTATRSINVVDNGNCILDKDAAEVH